MSIVVDLVRDMSLWKPQREGLEIFDSVMQTLSFGKDKIRESVLSGNEMEMPDLCLIFLVRFEIFTSIWGGCVVAFSDTQKSKE